MYRIELPRQKILDDFYNDYHQYILDGVDYFLNGKRVSFALGYKKIHLQIGVVAGSQSDFFLHELKKPKFLKYIMTCAPDDLAVIIENVLGLFAPGDEILASNKLTVPVYKKYYLGQQVVDHFFTIMHFVFVDWVFDGSRNGVKVFDKLQFNQNIGLSICPYCGAEDMTIRKAVRVKTTAHAKPDVDHFLPKSKYPYLAMSYANLIPSTEACNRQLKRRMNPLVTVNPSRYRLMYPYSFNPVAIVFSYDFDNTSYYSTEAYKVNVNYPIDPIMKEGYTQGLGIDSLYDQKKNLIVDLYKQMAGFVDIYQKMLIQLGVSAVNAPRMTKPDLAYVFGYECSEENSRRQPCFKFKYDIAIQMMADGGCGWPW